MRPKASIIVLAMLAASALQAQPVPRPVAAASQPAGPSDAERRFRVMLMQRALGFGGLFGPVIAPLNKPGAPAKSCGAYSDHAACQAYRNGDLWAADRLQQRRSTPAERDWYGH